jgi:hypothetical protein
MPTTVTRVTTLYAFAELSDAAKEKARKWWRRCEDESGDTFYAESVYEDLAQFLPLLGFTLAMRRGRKSEAAIYWSGFSSQGDGLCFEGRWCAAGVQPGNLAEYAPIDTVLHAAAVTVEAAAVAFPEASFVVRHRGFYSHQYCTSFDFDSGDGPDIEDTTERNLIDAFRAIMAWAYRQIEREYEYRMSDESVDENITINDYTFTFDGNRSDG